MEVEIFIRELYYFFEIVLDRYISIYVYIKYYCLFYSVVVKSNRW